MTAEQLARMTTDPRLTPNALRVVLYVFSLGEVGEGDGHDVKGEDLAILLGGGEKPIRAAIKRAVHCGYLESRFGGRSGNKLTFVPPKNDAPRGGNEKNDAPRGGNYGGNDAPRGGNSCTTTTTPTSTPSTPPTPPPGDDLGLVRLRRLLAPNDGALERLIRSTGTSAWAAEVVGWYHPPDETGRGHGTQWTDFRGLDPPTAMLALSTAIGDYASLGEGWIPRRFRGFARNAAGEARRNSLNHDQGTQKNDNGSDGGGRSRWGRGAQKAEAGGSGRRAPRDFPEE